MTPPEHFLNLPDDLPPEENINFQPHDLALFRAIEEYLSTHFDQLEKLAAQPKLLTLAGPPKPPEEIDVRKLHWFSIKRALLNWSLQKKEEIVNVRKLRVNQSSTILTGFPRTAENEKHCIVDKIIKCKDENGLTIKVIVTTDKVYLPPAMPVIIPSVFTHYYSVGRKK